MRGAEKEQKDEISRLIMLDLSVSLPDYQKRSIRDRCRGHCSRDRGQGNTMVVERYDSGRGDSRAQATRSVNKMEGE